ncbi:MAG: hypothetical protein ACON5B_04140 [Myxococcota bacterium]
MRSFSVAAATGVAVLLSMGRPARPLWLDESVQALTARAPTWSEVVHHHAMADMHPPLSMVMDLLTASWLPLEWSARWASLVAYLIAVPLAAWASQQWGATHADRAAWFMSLSPLVWSYGGEGRPYMLGMLVGLVVTGKLATSPASRWPWLVWLTTLWAAVVPLACALALRRVRIHRTYLIALPLVPLFWLQWHAQGAELSGGVLAPWLGLEGDGRSVMRLFGYLATGTGGRMAVIVGTLVGLVMLRCVVEAPRALVRWVVGTTVLFYMASLWGAYPFGPVRQVLVLLPLWLTVAVVGSDAWVSTRSWSLGLLVVALAGWWRMPPLPDERLQAAVDALPRGAHVLVEASVAPQWQVYHHDAWPAATVDERWRSDALVGPHVTRWLEQPGLRCVLTTRRVDALRAGQVTSYGRIQRVCLQH